MKLWRAIQLGSILSKDVRSTFGYLTDYGWKTCALGGAGLAVSRDRNSSNNLGCEGLWPDLLRQGIFCPAKCGQYGSRRAIIIHLYDDHKGSKKKIARWIQSFEEPDYLEKKQALLRKLAMQVELPFWIEEVLARVEPEKALDSEELVVVG